VQIRPEPLACRPSDQMVVENFKYFFLVITELFGLCINQVKQDSVQSQCQLLAPDNAPVITEFYRSDAF
jgi:hypothetical protein